MDKTPLILIGAGGHAHACIDVIESTGRYQIMGLVDRAERRGEKILGYSILGGDQDLSQIVKTCPNFLVTVGQIKNPTLRQELFEKACALGGIPTTVISAKAHCSAHASIGAGSIIMHFALVNAMAKVGRNCIVNNRALVEHDAILGDHCHLSTGAILNGGAQLGANSFLGSGCTVKENVRIGQKCIVGMGLVIKADIGDGQLLKQSAAP